jgi:hypothetical protein
MTEINFPWYYNPETIDTTSAAMVIFGAEHFKRAFVIQHLDALKLKVHERNNNLPPESDFHDFMKDFFFEKITDAIKICMFFENYMKAVLLSLDYLIHTIQKGKGCDELEKQQKKRPVKTKEFHDTQNFAVNEQQMSVHHEALTNHTLSFSTLLLKEKYQEVINLPQDLRDLLKVLMDQRNAHHFISEWTFESSEQYLDRLTRANQFVDELLSRYVSKKK